MKKSFAILTLTLACGSLLLPLWARAVPQDELLPPDDSPATPDRAQKPPLTFDRSSAPPVARDPLPEDAELQFFGDDPDPTSRLRDSRDDWDRSSVRPTDRVPEPRLAADPRDIALQKIQIFKQQIASGQGDRDKLEKNLKTALNEYFQADMRHRQKELGAIRKRLAEMEAKVKQRSDSQAKIVDLQLTLLLHEADGMGFFAPGHRPSDAPIRRLLPDDSWGPQDRTRNAEPSLRIDSGPAEPRTFGADEINPPDFRPIGS